MIVDMTTDKRIYFLTLGGCKMTDGNGRPLLFFPEDAKYHFDALVAEGQVDVGIGKDARYMRGTKHDSEL